MGTLVALYPKKIFSLLVPSSTYVMTADKLAESFDVSYSESGSNDRTKEETVVYLWFEYLQEAQGLYLIIRALQIV